MSTNPFRCGLLPCTQFVRTSLRPIAFVAAAWSVFALPAQADVVHSNLGPGDSYDHTSFYNIGGPNVGNYSVAAKFTTGPSAYVLTDAELPVATGPTLLPIHTLYLDVKSDTSGQPGATLDSTSVAIANNGYNVVLASGSFSGAITLQSNTTYWLVASAATNQELFWAMNTAGEVGKGTYFVDSDLWIWYDDPEIDLSPAFRILGEISTVPEPSTLLLAASLLPLLSHRRREHVRNSMRRKPCDANRKPLALRHTDDRPNDA